MASQAELRSIPGRPSRVAQGRKNLVTTKLLDGLVTGGVELTLPSESEFKISAWQLSAWGTTSEAGLLGRLEVLTALGILAALGLLGLLEGGAAAKAPEAGAGAALGG